MTASLRSQPSVVLYGRAGCHLCDEARAVVATVCAEAGAAWTEIDVDRDPLLVDRYGDYVPIVTVNGVRQGFWRIDAARLTAAIGRGSS